MGPRRSPITPPWPCRQAALKQGASEGLTLPELLISVAIVGLLSAISLPNYMNSIKATRQKDVANQISTIATSIGAYREEFLANPSSWDDLSRMSPVITNNGSAKGNSFTPITSTNGGHYTIAISNTGNLLSLNGTPVSSGSTNWDIKSCLNTQTGISDLKLGNWNTAAANPMCT
jgi:prepilin-type N-terminal cleavage/methylation domain-containing protein